MTQKNLITEYTIWNSNMICIKLRTGEEIMGQLDTDCDAFVSISDPVKIMYGYDAEGYYGLRMQRFMSYTVDDLYTFNNNDIVLTATPSDDIIALYSSYLETIRKSEQDDREADSLNSSLKRLH